MRGGAIGRWLACALLTAAAGCAADKVDKSDSALSPAIIVGRESDDAAGAVARAKTVIRRDAVVSYADRCGRIEISDRAIIPIEVTGGGLPELAVTFGRIHCETGLTVFSGTGGVMVQIWIIGGGPVRLLLEHQMHGFTPQPSGLLSAQHGGFCPDGAGPDQCLVAYRWNDKDRTLEVVERRLMSTLSAPPQMVFGWTELSR